MTTVQILALIGTIALILVNLPRMIEMSRGKPILFYVAVWLGIIVVLAVIYQAFMTG